MDVSLVNGLYLLILLLSTLNCAKSTSNPITMCYKPKFFIENNCNNPHAIPPDLEVSESIFINVSRMPFDTDLWLHIDVMPTPLAVDTESTIKIQFAMLQITDIDNRFMGRVAEQVPCNVQKYQGEHQHQHHTGEMSELYHNPGRKHIHIFECPFSEDLSFNVNPTVAVLEFTKPVEGFYINVKLTKTEMECIRDEAKKNRIFITTILVDDAGACHLHRLNDLEALPPIPPDKEIIVEVEVPIPCHSIGPSLNMSGDTGPFFMDPTDNPTFADLEFIDQSLVKPRLPSQMPKILRELWRKAVSYHNLRVYNIDSQGYIKGETQSGSGSSITRNENVELVIIDKDATGAKSLPVDMDDEICDDGLRNKTTENIDDTISQLYRKCGYLMGCIGEPDDCMENRNCRILVGWSIYRDQVQFEVLIARRIYVAVGISKDVKMGDDSVTECVRENGEVFGYTSWNYVRKGVKGNKRMRSCNPMQEFEGGIKETNDFLMYCSWKRPSVTKVKGITFNLGDPHYLLVAEGDYSSSGVLGNVGKHVESHVFSDALVLNDYFGKSPVEYWFAKIHGFLMIFAWLFMAPVASFTVRYLKGTFTNRRMYRYKYTFWFAIHGTLAAATIFVTLASVILLMGVDAHWIYEPEKLLSAHSILGFIIFFLLLAQMGLAYSMVKRPEKFKKLHLNFVHGVFGHVLVLCGFACVYTSKYERDGMDCDAAYVIFGYLTCYFIIHAFMSYQVCFTDFLAGRQTSRVYKVFLIDKPDEDGFDEPGSPARKVVFIVLIAVLAIFNLYFLIMAFHPASLDCASKDAMKPPNVLTLGLQQ